MQKKKDIEEYYKNKINKLIKYDEAYFEHDNPLIPDKDYDKLKKEILNLEKKYNYLKNKDSPSQKVGYKPTNKFKKIKHLKPMLSLSNAFEKDDMKDFLSKVCNFLNTKDLNIELSSEPKIDSTVESPIIVPINEKPLINPNPNKNWIEPKTISNKDKIVICFLLSNISFQVYQMGHLQ